MTRATQTEVSQRAADAFRPSDRVRIGAEVEWLVFHRDDPTLCVTASTTAAVAGGALPAGGTITIEPGGQLELVTLPAPGPDELAAAIDADTRVLVDRFARHGLLLVPIGLDPIRPARRTLDLPRYEAMERYFASRTPAGLEMMNRTASLQLNIDFGPHPDATWQLAARLAPLLSAVFANSPTTDGENFAAVSERQRVWAATDPSRTRPVGDTADAWHPYILDAQVMLVVDGPAGVSPPPQPQTFGAWLESADPPTRGELDLHLTTLFPPLRPRGYLELRMIDALPREGRAAAIGTVWTLLSDPAGCEWADEFGHPVPDPWDVATSKGLEDPSVRARATMLLDRVARRLEATHPELHRACDQWRARVETARVAASVDDLMHTAERLP